MVHLNTLKDVPVGVLGATGTVGQRFIKLLAEHPFFRIKALGASQRSAGLPLHKAVAGRWKQVTPIPASVRDIIVQECVPEHFVSCAIVFSGLDADVAGDIGECFDQVSSSEHSAHQRLTHSYIFRMES